jgi:hypothetical protein
MNLTPDTPYGFNPLRRVKPEDRQTVVLLVCLALASASLFAAIHLLLHGSIL